jgi:hypothetical protein
MDTRGLENRQTNTGARVSEWRPGAGAGKGDVEGVDRPQDAGEIGADERQFPRPGKRSAWRIRPLHFSPTPFGHRRRRIYRVLR